MPPKVWKHASAASEIVLFPVEVASTDDTACHSTTRASPTTAAPPCFVKTRGRSRNPASAARSAGVTAPRVDVSGEKRKHAPDEHDPRETPSEPDTDWFSMDTTLDATELLKHMRNLCVQFENNVRSLERYIEPVLAEAKRTVRSLDAPFSAYFNRLTSKLPDVLSSHTTPVYSKSESELRAEQRQALLDVLSYIDNRCKEVKILKRTNDSKAEEVKRVLACVEKLVYASTTAHDVRRLPASVRPLIRPTFDYVPSTNMRVARFSAEPVRPRAVSVHSMLPRHADGVQCEPSTRAEQAEQAERAEQAEQAERSEQAEQAEQAERAEPLVTLSESELEAELMAAMMATVDPTHATESPPDASAHVVTTPATLIVQFGTKAREQTMAPSQRSMLVTQSAVRRFTSPLDSSSAHAAKRASRYADADALRLAYADARKNRTALRAAF